MRWSNSRRCNRRAGAHRVDSEAPAHLPGDLVELHGRQPASWAVSAAPLPFGGRATFPATIAGDVGHFAAGRRFRRLLPAMQATSLLDDVSGDYCRRCRPLRCWTTFPATIAGDAGHFVAGRRFRRLLPAMQATSLLDDVSGDYCRRCRPLRCWTTFPAIIAGDAGHFVAGRRFRRLLPAMQATCRVHRGAGHVPGDLPSAQRPGAKLFAAPAVMVAPPQPSSPG